MPAASIGAAAGGHQGPGFAVSAVTRQLIEAWSCLLALLDQPDDIAMLAPIREREIPYRLLQGPLGAQLCQIAQEDRSEEHTSELQSLMRISYAVFCLKKKQTN